MIALETPDLILKELRGKVSMVKTFAAIAFAASGILVVPLIALAKKLSVQKFIAGFFVGTGISTDVASNIAGLIVLILALNLIADLIERKLLPVFFDMVDEPAFKTEHLSTLSDADAVLLDPIIRSANGHGLARARISDDKSGWTFRYVPWIKYPIMFFSTGLVYGLIDWLFK